MTIYDIAKLAGVSASTVSRVVNNKPGIRQETRDKIKKLLEENNYVPDENARGLVNSASRMIGILIVDVRYAYHVDIAYTIEMELRKRGYCGLIFNTGLTDEKKVEAIRLLEQRRVEGAILVGSAFQCNAVKQAIQDSLSKIPVIMTNGYLDLPNVKGVLVDERSGVEDCIGMLVSKNHRHIAFIQANQTYSNNQKCKGFRDGIRKFLPDQADNIEDWIYTSPTTLEDGYNIVAAILKDHPDTDAMIFSEDMAGVGAMRAVMDLGISIPDKMALIGVDNSNYCQMCYPKLTALNNRNYELSIEASRLLFDYIDKKECPDKIELACEIVEREST